MINLFINYFDHQNKDRKKELEYCLEKNKRNKLIDNIIIVNRNERSTYGDFLRAMNDYPNDVNIIANADIYFDNTIEYANQIKKMECYALTRWELYNGTVMTFNQRHGRPSPPHWSQDAWIFRGSFKHNDFDNVIAVNPKRQNVEIPFQLGIPGCDNKIAALLREKGFNVTNPSLVIRAIHVHKNSNRSYPAFQILKGIKPNGLVYQSGL